MSQAAASAGKEWFGHPKGLSTLFFTELWERLSYYGMRAILVLFMVDQLENGGFGLTDGKAAAIYGLYTAGVYLLALPGGWIADRIMGQQKAVFWGGVVIAAGHFTMALPIIPGLDGLSAPTFYGGLILIVIGTGLLKPNVSAIVGDLYPEKGAQRDAGFSLFYMGINFGALLGPLVCSWLGEDYNWHLGFSAAGIGMVFGLIQYQMGLRHLGDAGTLKNVTPLSVRRDTAKMWAGIAAVVGTIVVVYFLRDSLGLTVESLAGLTGFLIVGLAVVYFGSILIFGDLTSLEKKRVFVISLLFVGAALFWSGFEQAGSSMNLFAERHTNLEGPLVPLFLGLPILGILLMVLRPMMPGKVLYGLIGVAAAGLLGWSFFGPGATYVSPTGWLQSVNPMFIIVLAPVFGWLWVALGSKEPSIPMKFGAGLVLLGLGFLVLAWGSTYISDNPNGVTPMWLIFTYFLHTAGELCLSPVGLSSVTKLSPHRLVGQMMGTWFMGASLGNLIAGLVAGRIEMMEMDDLFRNVALIVIVAGAFFIVFTIPIKAMIGDLKSDE
ncbi:MAG: peptide MFS transporter [Acidobacteriota bacterium]